MEKKSNSRAKADFVHPVSFSSRTLEGPGMARSYRCNHLCTLEVVPPKAKGTSFNVERRELAFARIRLQLSSCLALIQNQALTEQSLWSRLSVDVTGGLGMGCRGVLLSSGALYMKLFCN